MYEKKHYITNVKLLNQSSMKNIDLYITAIALLIGVAIFTIAGFAKNETWMNAGVIVSLVSFIPVLVTSTLKK